MRPARAARICGRVSILVSARRQKRRRGRHGFARRQNRGGQRRCRVFRLRVSYDPAVLRFAGVSPSPQIEAGTLQTNAASNPVCSVYVCGVDRGYAPPLSGTVITYYFHVLEGAPSCETDVCACADETCDYSAQNLSFDTYETLSLGVTAAASTEARLIALRPSEGELSPAFTPDVFSYRLRVGSAVSSVTFQADASEGAA